MRHSGGIQAISILLLFTGCLKDKVINDAGNKCTGNCTVIKGRAVTSGGKPVGGIRFIFTHITTSRPGCIFCPKTTRIISKATTDKNGDYEMNFYLNDDEVGNGSGYFELYPDAGTVSGKYFIGSEYERTEVFYHIADRDTVIDKPCYFPEKTTVKVNLKGFKKSNASDRFEAQSLFSAGFKIDNPPNTYLGGIYGTGATPYGSYVATSDNYSANVIVANGDSTVIRVSRIKNGQGLLYEEKRILATANNNIELTFDF